MFKHSKQSQRFQILAVVVGVIFLITSCSQRNPETVARDYFEALSTGDCEKVGTYITADRKLRDYTHYAHFCGENPTEAIVSMEIQDVIIRDIPYSPMWGSKSVTFVGKLVTSRNGYELVVETWAITLEEVDGKWYVVDD